MKILDVSLFVECINKLTVGQSLFWIKRELIAHGFEISGGQVFDPPDLFFCCGIRSSFKQRLQEFVVKNHIPVRCQVFKLNFVVKPAD